MKVKILYTSNCLLFILAVVSVLMASTHQSIAQAEMNVIENENYTKIINSFFQKGDWEEGKKIIDSEIKKNPKDSDLRMLLGKYYFINKQYDLARFELIEALQYNKDNIEAKQILVNVEIESQHYSSAICYINELLEVNPYWKGLWTKKMEVYRLQGNKEEANRLLKRLNQIYPDDSDIKTAYIYYIEEEIGNKKKEGKIDKAIELSTILIEENPHNEEFYIELANNCLKAGDYVNAVNNLDKGLYNLPNSIKLIDKKIEILAEKHLYEDLLSFINQKLKTSSNKTLLNQRYNYYLEEAARYYKKTDAYTMYSMLFERNPNNMEAFNYIVTMATANGLYDDALTAIKTVKEKKGETKELLLREQEVYKRVGEQGKLNQIIVKLYQLHPEDSDIRSNYCLYRLEQAKSTMAEGLYERALNHWKFIVESGDEELEKTALIAIYNCSFQLGMFDDALAILDRLKQEYPDELEWSAKKSVIYGKQKKYITSLAEYERVIRLSDPDKKDQLLNEYEEFAITYIKQLLEDNLLNDAAQVIKRCLDTHPKSIPVLKYAINITAQIKDYEKMIEYAQRGLDNNPNDIHFQIKMAEAYNAQKKYEQSLDIISPLLTDNPYHKDLINTHSQASEDYAKILLYDLKLKESRAILDKALLYDPDNKTLNYWKGINFEKEKIYDSAYYYLSRYEPSPFEVKPFTRHINFLASKTYNNQISIYHLRSRFGDIDQITTISTIEYLRSGVKNTYTGRINYTGRDEGKGIQAQLEWNHTWRPDLYTRIDAAVANKFFSTYAFNGSVYKTFKSTWEAELGLGYRKLADDKGNMLNIVAGIANEWDPWWINARFNSVILKSKWYYSIMAQARYYVIDNGYLSAMASFGSAPDVDIIDSQLYNGFSVTNSMVGLGGYYMINKAISVGLLGTWYNYEDTNYNYENENAKYRNLYNIYLQLHVNF